MTRRLIKEWTKAVFRSFGLYFKLVKNIPFGIEWYQDIQYFPNGRKLEIVVDVGANIGQTALTTIKHFPDSLIYCFEPVPSTFDRLLTSIQIFPQVKPINQALGDRKSKAPMTAKPLAEQNTLVMDRIESTGENCETVLVDVNTLDNFCSENGINKINLLKIDTEGYEMNVLKGAEQLLSSNSVDYILIECDFFRRPDEPHGNFFEIFNYLQPFQYYVVSFYTSGVDSFGWLWGDVLFRKATSEYSVNGAVSPFQKKAVSSLRI